MATVKFSGLDNARTYFKKMQEKTRNPKTYLDKIGAIGFKNVIKHFREEMGPDGRWEPIIQDTGRTKRARKSKKNPKILQDTGLLRASTRWKVDGNDAIVYNRTKYADYHEQQHKKYSLPKRSFMWMDRAAIIHAAKTIMKSIVGK